MTNPENGNQNAGLPSYSDIASSGSEAAYSNAQAFGSEGLITDKKNPLALWALILGIVSLGFVIVFIFAGVAFVPGIIGLILSIIALVKGKKYAPENRRTVLSVIGLVTSIIATVISVGLLGFTAYKTQDCVQIADPTAKQECILEKLSN